MACILRGGTLVGAPFDLDFEHVHTTLSSTRFENVIVAIDRQRLAVPIQFDKCGLRAAGDTQFPALIGGWDLKDIIKENGHLDEVRPPRLVVFGVYWFLHFALFKET